ncbi:MAG: hypothetical protein P0Y53_05895 [Candidatus Pseudobacter hemicellulosilyticus]|uniref:Uncharacterized protein n=1 Tax=Candidatus Pseudobacter hemicellulosilyticus TaxID=3121375 RepID=A0AAJ5WUW8_9BACT|nr:MAG: hypothetical protein P0Y53_05895 [Pseudobacter sp.]
MGERLLVCFKIESTKKMSGPKDQAAVAGKRGKAGTAKILRLAQGKSAVG